MRSALWIIAVLVLFAAMDAVANDFRFTTAVYFEVIEFGRLVSRYVSQAF
jgi:hypothetical protein